MPLWGASAVCCCAQAIGLLSTAMLLGKGVRGQGEPPFPTNGKDVFTSSAELINGRSHDREEGAEGTERMAGVFRGEQRDSVEQQLLVGATDNLVAESEKPEPTPLRTKNDTAAIWITRPLNDTLLPLGDIFLTFETHGFTTAVETPIEVFLPKYGDAPFLLEKGNSMVLSSDMPCTQHVTLYATVRGERVSASVLFSTVLDREAILSSRTPLPSGAVWGRRPRAMACPSRIREQEEGDNSASLHKGDTSTWQTHESGTDVMVGKGGLYSSGSAESQRIDSGEETTEGVPRPVSLVFVGSLSLDGQKHVWLQQLEQLSRVRFAPKFLTFEEQEGTHSSTVGAWKANAAESFKHRLSRAGVPLVTVRLPKVNSSWIHDRIGGEAPTNTLKEVAFKAVLESIHRAGGKPHLMSPPWTGEIFQYIADGIESASPDVLVIANGKTLGDDLLTKAARWAMRDNSGFKIVMDFPNIGPALGVDIDVIATPSHYVARHRDTEALAAAAGAEVVVIPPGVPVASTLSRAETLLANEVLPLDRPSGEVVGFAGRLAPEKGPGLFMVVAEALAKLIPSAVFVVVGDGPLRTSLEAAAERMGMASRMHFAGWADEGDLERLLAGMTLLFNPSLSQSETFSIVNIQAMSVGTPVAAFGIGGMLEYGNLALLDDTDPGAISTAMANLLLDRPRLEALAERGRARVSSAFRADVALDRWADLYETLGKGMTCSDQGFGLG